MQYPDSGLGSFAAGIIGIEKALVHYYHGKLHANLTTDKQETKMFGEGVWWVTA